MNDSVGGIMGGAELQGLRMREGVSEMSGMKLVKEEVVRWIEGQEQKKGAEWKMSSNGK